MNPNTSVTFKNVSMMECEWHILNLNVIIIESKIPFFRLKANSTDQTRIVDVLLQNSTIGSVKIGSGFNVTIINSYINGSERIQETLINVKHSSVGLINTTFVGNTAGKDNIILKASLYSNILIKRCLFLNNTGKRDLINAVNGTILTIENSNFISNRVTRAGFTMLGVYFNSTAIITKCSFSDNLAPFGSVIVSSNGRFVVTNSSFVSNVAIGAVVYSFTNSTLLSSHSLYRENVASYEIILKRYNISIECKLQECFSIDIMAGGIVYGSQSYVIFKNDTFVGNKAKSIGGVMVLVEGSKLETSDSKFYQTVGDGVISARNSTLSIVRCAFIENVAEVKFKIGVIIGSTSKIKIENSSFVDNIGKTVSCIYIKNGFIFLKNNFFTKNGNSSKTALLFEDK